MNKDVSNFLDNSKSIFTLKDAKQAGVSSYQINKLIDEKRIIKISHGVYALSNSQVDLMYAHQLNKEFNYSHETALYLHDLTDRDPLTYSVTVKKGYHSKTLEEKGFDVYFVDAEKYAVGMTTNKTIFNNPVKTYSMERTICDVLRSSNRMDKNLVLQAIRSYSKRKDKDMYELMKIARIFSVQSEVRFYMEILLE